MQGSREPWINPQNYRSDKKMFRTGALEDGVLAFDNVAAASETVPPSVSRPADREALTASRR
jgi:hypothetical protein